MSPAQSEHYSLEDTERSWGIYQEIHSTYPNAIVIGGWGAWLHNRAAKSHDIDMIVEPHDLAEMRETLELSESSHLGSSKWRGTYDDVHLYVYVTYRSHLGQILMLPVEGLVAHREDIDGYPTLSKEALLVAKAAALLDRPDTQPGLKDAEDMTIMLLRAPSEWDFDTVCRVADSSQSPETTGSGLVLRAVERLLDVAKGSSDRKRLREMVRALRGAVEGSAT